MNRNPAGGAEVPQEGGYQEEHRATFGAGTRPHEHVFVDVGAAFKGKPGLRCRYCYMTREETEHGH